MWTPHVIDSWTITWMWDVGCGPHWAMIQTQYPHLCTLSQVYKKTFFCDQRLLNKMLIDLFHHLIYEIRVFFFSFTVLMTMTSRRPTKASPRRLTITTITPPPCSRRPRPLTSPQCQPFRGRPPPRPPPPARPPPALQHHSCSFSLTASRTYPSILPPCPSCRRSPTPMLWVRW